ARGQRQRVDDLEPFGQLATRELLRLEKRDQLVERRRYITLGGNDDRADALAHHAISDRDDCDGTHLGMLVQQVFQLLAADLLTAADDDVLQPPGNGEISIGIAHPEIAGAKEAACIERVVIERRVAVAEEQLGTARPDLTFLTARHGPAVAITQLDLVVSDR